MRDLLPLSAYENASTPSFGRSTVVLGLLWAIPMSTFMLQTHQGSLGFVLIIGAIGALIFGSLITMLARFARRQLTQAVYYCVWPIVPAPPPGQFEARLMCSLIRGRLPVGGHLYIGPEAWAFVPHARNGPLGAAKPTIRLRATAGMGLARVVVRRARQRSDRPRRRRGPSRARRAECRGRCSGAHRGNIRDGSSMNDARCVSR
jgi:hypothetical protein